MTGRSLVVVSVSLVGEAGNGGEETGVERFNTDGRLNGSGLKEREPGNYTSAYAGWRTRLENSPRTLEHNSARRVPI